MTKPKYFSSFSEPYSEKARKLFKLQTWTMVITESEIQIIMDEKDAEIKLGYKENGNYLLADFSLEEKVRFLPFYVENAQTIHGFGTVFFREE